MQTLFDKDGLLNISDIVNKHPSYIKIMEDKIVTEQELAEQANTTILALRKLQSMCNEAQQAAILDAISEMSVLYAAHRYHELQNLTF